MCRVCVCIAPLSPLPCLSPLFHVCLLCSGGLWRKGDTSGAWQALRSVRLDCDSDALMFTVKQMGTVPAFCHLNTRNCWGEDAGLGALEVGSLTIGRYRN